MSSPSPRRPRPARTVRRARLAPPSWMREHGWLIDALRAELDELNPLGMTRVAISRRRTWPQPRAEHVVTLRTGPLEIQKTHQHVDQAILSAFQEAFDIVEPLSEEDSVREPAEGRITEESGTHLRVDLPLAQRHRVAKMRKKRSAG